MKKKTYTRPHATMVRVAALQILAGTTIDASGNNTDLETDDEGFGWAD